VSNRRAFVILPEGQTEHGFIPAMVTENEPGYGLMSGNGPGAAPWYWGDRELAERTAKSSNEKLGLSEQDVADIIRSAAERSVGWAGRVEQYGTKDSPLGAWCTEPKCLPFTSIGVGDDELLRQVTDHVRETGHTVRTESTRTTTYGPGRRAETSALDSDLLLIRLYTNCRRVRQGSERTPEGGWSERITNQP
jgi:hypothetical protein